MGIQGQDLEIQAGACLLDVQEGFAAVGKAKEKVELEIEQLWLGQIRETGVLTPVRTKLYASGLRVAP